MSYRSHLELLRSLHSVVLQYLLRYLLRFLRLSLVLLPMEDSVRRLPGWMMHAWLRWRRL